jgi:uncharacterized membrane protein YccC
VTHSALTNRLRDPVRWASAAQLLKTAIAAVAAWLVSVRVLHTSQPFLAPWAALLTVHATVFGTFRRGLQQGAASVLGVLIAFAAGHLFGLNALSLGAAVLVGLVAGSIRGLRAETTTAAATALIVLTTGYSNDSGVLAGRLVDTGVGIGMGLLVNLLVWPPLRDRSAAHQIDSVGERIGALLTDIVGDLRRGSPDAGPEQWIAATEQLDEDIDEAWGTLRQARESGRLNPRPAAPRRMRAAQSFGTLLERLGQAVAETRSLARTIGLTHVAPLQWHPSFREPWLQLVDRAGRSIAAAEVEAVRRVRSDLEAFAGGLALEQLPDGFWPVAGALLVNLRNILEALDEVAERRPLEVPSPSWTRPAPSRPAVAGRPPPGRAGR